MTFDGLKLEEDKMQLLGDERRDWGVNRFKLNSKVLAKYNYNLMFLYVDLKTKNPKKRCDLEWFDQMH